MEYETLYQRIEKTLRPNDPPVSAKDVVRDFKCSESHAKTTLDWMATKTPPTMMALGGSPKKWQRI